MNIKTIVEKLVADRAIEVGHSQMVDLFVRKISKSGYRVSTKQKAQLRKWIIDGAKGSFDFEDGKTTHQNIQINVSTRETRRILGKVRKTHLADTEKAISAALTTASDILLKEFKRTWPKHSKHQKREEEKFRKHLQNAWGNPIALLSMLLKLSRDIGDEVLEEIHLKNKIKTPCLIEAIAKLHARACQISEEIIVLMRSGFADGAIARWRSLHEVSVVLFFIWQHGEFLARRYLDHNIIESYRAALGHDATCAKFDRSPISENDWNELRKERSNLLKKYGDDFDEDYGWATAILKRKRPKFSDIQKFVELDHWKADYKFASNNVHAGSKGISFRLGSPVNDHLLSGSSDFGLCDPGQNTAIALVQVSSVIIQLAPDLDLLSTVKALEKLTEEIGLEFLDTHNRVMNSLQSS